MDQPVRLAFDDQRLREITDLAAGRAEDLLESALDTLPQSIAIIDSDGNTVAVNATCRKYVLETQGRAWLPGMSFLDSLKACPVPEVSAALEASLPALISGSMRAFQRTYEVQFAGQVRVKQLKMVRFIAERGPLLVFIHEDVTDITSAQREVDVLGQQLLASQEEERERIAMELHDSTGQHLVAASLALASLRRAQQSAGAPLIPKADTALTDAAASVSEAQKQIRLMSYLLHPPNLEQDGLATSLRVFVSGFSRRSGLRCTLRIRGPTDDLDLGLQRDLFRVAQEALLNVHRHAGASGAAISLTRTRQHLTLMVRDDGHGADGALDLQTKSLGIGIPSMRARLRQLGGWLEMVDSPAGMTVKAVAPLAARTTQP